ncbi:MAG: beta-N-acetylhexosaminidase [Bacteroidetes bacterium]|nr:beta-N-acetylhexosaminidase [Bacteroidota bacterium]
MTFVVNRKNVFILLGIFIVLNVQFSFSQICPIIPSPATYKEFNESLLIEKTVIVDSTGLSENLKNQLKEIAFSYHKMEIKFSSNESQLKFKKLVNVIENSYSINVSNDITISYSSDASCFYAFHSFMQLINSDSEGYSLKKCFVKDYPKFQWRGLHLDVSRHFFTVEEVKRYIDLMSMYKFNTFHWHLTDDQGWRIEIKQFPKLTEIGAWRDSTVENHYTTKPRTYKKERYGGFYTQEQIKEVVAYAASKYITIVPEIEMPGHSRAALAAYPEYSCTGKELCVEGLWGVFDDIFCSKDETISFLQKILDEVALLFPGEFIHIGGDEAPKKRWKECEKCQNVINTNNLKDEHELQSYFIQKMDKYLASKGKKLIGWDEILEGGLSQNAAVMSWRGFDGGIEAAKQEHYVVMSPGSHCYFDHYQGKKNEPLAIGGYTPLEKAYEFNPIPPDLDEKYHSYILGGQANLWTEYIADFKKLEYMTYPRAIALSQTLWSIEKPDYNTFKYILSNNHFKYLEAKKVNFSKTAFLPEVEWKRSKGGLKFRINASKESGQIELSYSRNEILINDYSKTGNNTNVTFAPNSWIQVKRPKKGITNHHYYIKTTENSSSSHFIINATHALGLPIKYITEPSPNYNGGDLTLVDGQFGSLPWKGNEWIGFNKNKIQIELDLGKKMSNFQVFVRFLSDENSWIYFPNDVKIVLDDAFELVNPKIELNDNQQIKTFSFQLSKKTQKVKLVIDSIMLIPSGLPGEGNIPWTFIDEIQILR